MPHPPRTRGFKGTIPMEKLPSVQPGYPRLTPMGCLSLSRRGRSFRVRTWLGLVARNTSGTVTEPRSLEDGNVAVMGKAAVSPTCFTWEENALGRSREASPSR